MPFDRYIGLPRAAPKQVADAACHVSAPAPNDSCVQPVPPEVKFSSHGGGAGLK